MSESGEGGRESDSRVCSSKYFEMARTRLVLGIYKALLLKRCFSLRWGQSVSLSRAPEVPCRGACPRTLPTNSDSGGCHKRQRENYKSLYVSWNTFAKHFYFTNINHCCIYGFVLLFPSLEYFYLEFTGKLYQTLMWIPKERYTSSLMFWNVRKSLIERVSLVADYNLPCCWIVSEL